MGTEEEEVEEKQTNGDTEQTRQQYQQQNALADDVKSTCSWRHRVFVVTSANIDRFSQNSFTMTYSPENLQSLRIPPYVYFTEQRVSGAVGSLVISSLQIFRRVCQWQNFENRSVFCWSYDKNSVMYFFDSQCTCTSIILTGWTLALAAPWWQHKHCPYTRWGIITGPVGFYCIAFEQIDKNL